MLSIVFYWLTNDEKNIWINEENIVFIKVHFNNSNIWEKMLKKWKIFRIIVSFKNATEPLKDVIDFIIPKLKDLGSLILNQSFFLAWFTTRIIFTENIKVDFLWKK